jgi:N-acetylglucosamine-6-phosphate deacetylase
VTLLPEALSRTSESLGLDEVSLQNLGSQNAAEDLGLPRRGSLRTDYRADLVIHGDSGIEAVMRGGLSVEDADGPRLPASIEQIR